MRSSVLTLGCSGLLAAAQQLQGSANELLQDRAAVPLWNAGSPQEYRIHRRQAGLEPPYVPDGVGELCDDYDLYFYRTPGGQNMTFQLQCTHVVSGSSVPLFTQDNTLFEDCIAACAASNVVDTDPPLCAGVMWNAPFGEPGTCTTYESIAEIQAGSEEGGHLEVAIFIRGPDGKEWAAPSPFPTPATTTTAATTETTPAPAPTTNQFVISVVVDRVVVYVAFENDHAILIVNREDAAHFEIDEFTGYLFTNDSGVMWVYSASTAGTATLQRFMDLPEPPASQYFWTRDEAGLTFSGASSFCAYTDPGPNPDAPIELNVVYGSDGPADGCNAVTINAEPLDGPLPEPTTTTTAPAGTSSSTAASASASTFEAQASTTSAGSTVVPPPLSPLTSTTSANGGNPTLSATPPTVGTFTNTPSAPTSGVSTGQPTMSGGMTTTHTPLASTGVTTPSATPSITTGTNGQTTTFWPIFITTFEVQPTVSCNEASQCASGTTVRPRVATRTGVSCSPGACDGSVNYLVDALFADPICLIRPSAV